MASLNEISLVNGVPRMGLNQFPMYTYTDRKTKQTIFKSPFPTKKRYVPVSSILKDMPHPVLTHEYNRMGVKRVLHKLPDMVERANEIGATDKEGTSKLLDEATPLFETPYTEVKPWHVGAFVEQLLWDKNNTVIDEETMGSLGEAQKESIIKALNQHNLEAIATGFTFWNDKFEYAGVANLVKFNGETVLFDISTAQKVSRAKMGIKLSASLGGYTATRACEKVNLPVEVGGLVMHTYGDKISFISYTKEELVKHKKQFLGLRSIYAIETLPNDVEGL